MKSSMKLVCLALLVLIAAVNAQHPCDTRTTGDWCFGTGFVSCPYHATRQCQTGLVCSQYQEGVVYCLPPNLLPPTEPPKTTVAPTATPTAPATCTPVTEAPTQKPPTEKPTAAPTPAATQKPTSAPVTSAPTQKPTDKPTDKPTEKPTSAPVTSAPTQKPTSAPVTSAPTQKPTQTPSGWPNGPVKAIYMDINCWGGKSSFTQVADAGYNLLVLAFFMQNSPTTGNLHYTDCAQAFAELSPADRTAVISYLHTAGTKIIVSTGGATETTWWSSWGTGAAAGTAVANYAKTYGLDGVDFDLEWIGAGFTAGSLSTAQTVNWICDATNAVSAVLGSSAIITHAPQPPYFSALTTSTFANGYGQVYAKCGGAISYFMIQMYNNGILNTYDAIFGGGYPAWGSSSVTQIQAAGVPLNKIVVGKPVATNDADVSGYNTAAQLNTFFTQAKSQLGWNAGVMGWQWHDYNTNANWINTIYTN